MLNQVSIALLTPFCDPAPVDGTTFLFVEVHSDADKHSTTCMYACVALACRQLTKRCLLRNLSFGSRLHLNLNLSSYNDSRGFGVLGFWGFGGDV